MAMKPGGRVRFTCDDCVIEYEITYEPKAKKQEAIPDADDPLYCPWCGVEVSADDADEPDEGDDDEEEDDDTSIHSRDD